MAKSFNIESYRAELNAEIARLESELATLRANRYSKFWEIRDLQDKINELALRRDPKFVCELMWSDRHAYEVLRMESANRMVIRRLVATRTNVGEYYMSDAQDYTFESNPQAPEITIRLRKNGLWYAANNCDPFRITEEPYEYFDYSF